MAEVARYIRRHGGFYRVVRDCTAHKGVGVYRVYVGNKEIGRQSSFPSLGDCERLEHPAATPRSAPILSHTAQRDASLLRAQQTKGGQLGGRAKAAAFRIKRPA